MSEHLIKVENLTLSYENVTVVRELSFAVESGDYLCIVGENGSGKSTLVKSLLSLKKPVGGSITFGGGLRRNEIGYLPQQTGAQHDFPASVEEVVISGCLNSMGFRPFYTERERRKAAENMERLSITDLRKRSFRELSGGQQQRVLLARALCATSKLLLLDEHTAALDPKTAAKVMKITEKIVEEDKLTTLMITHNMRDAIRYGNRLIMLHEGRIILDISGEEKKGLTVTALLEMFTKASGDEFASDKAILS